MNNATAKLIQRNIHVQLGNSESLHHISPPKLMKAIDQGGGLLCQFEIKSLLLFLAVRFKWGNYQDWEILPKGAVIVVADFTRGCFN